MSLPLYVVDAFTSRRFHGNPAAVCPLSAWLPATAMQQIAAENNLSETAFVVQSDERWLLRWFTPVAEIELCGHATLATAFVLAQLHPTRTEFRFDTLSGELVVTRTVAASRNTDRYTLDFPQRSPQPLNSAVALSECLGVPVLQVAQTASVWLAELQSAQAVQQFKPDFAAIAALDCRGLIITARGDDCDFVSRFFVPKMGVNEDPVTGSAHCGLVPYWSAKLGKTTFFARQLSARGGELWCELSGERVLMSGHAVLYSEGTIFVDGY